MSCLRDNAMAVVGVLCAASLVAGQSVLDEYGQVIDDAAVESAAWLQQPGAMPSLATSQPAVRRSTAASRLSGTSLASVPNMFGDDCGMTTALVTIVGPNGQITESQFMLPIVGGARTTKMAENDIAMPVDRV